ncbi:hypothetical protein HB904_12885 [Listeria booriae]|uniref:Uncharacterized protein n=1 Tax=Listeria booriae TaxID=1552123 RepID=A0A842AGP9_9LIST|nr:hypothetical protein [Listeria booriae]
MRFISALKATHFYDILDNANEFMVVGSLLFMKVGGAMLLMVSPGKD